APRHSGKAVGTESPGTKQRALSQLARQLGTGSGTGSSDQQRASSQLA
ncbi:unnamed protein product, partial [Staurois parvus]